MEAQAIGIMVGLIGVASVAGLMVKKNEKKKEYIPVPVPVEKNTRSPRR